ncbi:MAG: organic solvent tolerance protein OstA, partial [Bacteroidetes bacterium]|nr:organic solvent tolerance protein OstA [Bacteroidota bacterium]
MLWHQPLIAQEDATRPSTRKSELQKIKILNADLLKYDELGGVKVRKLIGNVKLQREDVIMSCDSAFFYRDPNNIDAFGHVHIKQGNSLDIYSDSLKYVAETKTATLYNNVKLIQGSLEIKTDKLYYDLDRKVAKYFSGANLKTGKTRLYSRIGYYFEATGNAYFKDSVVLIDPSYRLYSDTLRYNARSEISYFYGPTDIITDSNKVYCEDGWYDAARDVAFFKKNAHVENGAQIIDADSIYLEEKTGYGEAFSNVVWVDTSRNTIINCDYAEYFQKKNLFFATKNPVLTNIIGKDSMFIAGDTLRSFMDSTDSIRHRVFLAFHNVRIFKSNMQGLCDSLAYSYHDSTFRLYYDPVVWVEGNQMTADTITMTLKNDKMDRLDMIRSAFMVNSPDPILFNQIKGKNIYGYFKNDSLRKMDVIGNGESMYYADDDSGRYIG